MSLKRDRGTPRSAEAVLVELVGLTGAAKAMRSGTKKLRMKLIAAGESDAVPCAGRRRRDIDTAEVVALYTVMPASEIAKRLGCSRQTIHNRLAVAGVRAGRWRTLCGKARWKRASA